MKTLKWISRKRPDTAYFRTIKEAEQVRVNLHQNLIRVEFLFETVYMFVEGMTVKENDGKRTKLAAVYINELGVEFVGEDDPYAPLLESERMQKANRLWESALYARNDPKHYASKH